MRIPLLLALSLVVAAPLAAQGRPAPTTPTRTSTPPAAHPGAGLSADERTRMELARLSQDVEDLTTRLAAAEAQLATANTRRVAMEAQMNAMAAQASSLKTAFDSHTHVIANVQPINMSSLWPSGGGPQGMSDLRFLMLTPYAGAPTVIRTEHP